MHFDCYDWEPYLISRNEDEGMYKLNIILPPGERKFVFSKMPIKPLLALQYPKLKYDLWAKDLYFGTDKEDEEIRGDIMSQEVNTLNIDKVYYTVDFLINPGKGGIVKPVFTKLVN